MFDWKILTIQSNCGAIRTHITGLEQSTLE